MIEAFLQHTGGGGYGQLIPPEKLGKVLSYMGLGVAYSLVGWVKERSRTETPEPFSPRKATQTILVGAVAGIIVATQGQEFNQTTFEANMAIAVPIVNELLNAGKAERRKAKNKTSSDT